MRKKQPDIITCDICGKEGVEIASQRSDKILLYHEVIRFNSHGGTQKIDQCLDCVVKVNAFFAIEGSDKDGS